MSNPSDAPKKVDVAYFSGVLQYLSDPAYQLSPAALRDADFVFMTRTPLGEHEQAFVQIARYDHGDVSYPGRLIPKAWLEQRLAALGYTLIASWQGEQTTVGGVQPTPSLLWRRTGAVDTYALSKLEQMTQPPPQDALRTGGALEAKVKLFTWPETRPSIKPVRWMPNLWGREPIVDLINRKRWSTLIELGTFLGGGSLYWLENCANLSVFGIDRFPGDFNVGEDYVSKRADLLGRVSFPESNELEFVSQWSQPGSLFPGEPFN